MCVWNEKCQFFPNGVVWWLGLATWLSRESELQFNCMARPEVLSCSAPAGVTLQLPCMFHTCASFGDLPVARFSRKALLSAHSWAFFHILSHTTLTWFPPKYRVLNAELQKKWHRIKLTKWLINFNLTKASSRKQKNTIFGSYCQYYCRYHTSHVVVMLVWSTPQLRRRK